MLAPFVFALMGLSAGARADDGATLQQAWQVVGQQDKPAESAPAPKAEPAAQAAAPSRAPAPAPTPAAAPADSSGNPYEIVPANTLWDLAERFYKDPYKWRIIYNANLDKIKDPHWIYPGQMLTIPGFGEVRTVARPAQAPHPEAAAEDEQGGPEAAAARKAAFVEPKFSDTMPAEDDSGEMHMLSKSMPEHMIGYGETSDESVVPLNWKADGVVRNLGEETLGTISDTIEFKPAAALRPGARLAVYRPGNKLPKGQIVEKVAVVQVESVDGRTAKAKILEETDSVQGGDWVKAEGK